MNRLLASVVVVALAAAAFADDVLVLTNGREVRGTVVEDTDAGVRLEIAGGKMFYPRKLIREVRRGAAETKTETPPAEPAGPAETREEYALVYDDGRRVGTRTFHASKVPEG